MTSNDNCADNEGALAREGSPPELAKHVIGCDPCGASLDVLKAQSDALKYLARPAEGAAHRSAVERVLARTAEAGKKKLCDLLYELTRACLILVPEVRPDIMLGAEPLPVDTLVTQGHALESRLCSAGRAKPRGVPVLRPDVTRTLGAAERCLSSLRSLEGESDSVQMLEATLLVYQSRGNEAVEKLQRLAAAAESDSMRSLALHKLNHAYVTEERYTEAIQLGEKLLGAGDKDRLVQYHLAIAYAGAGRAAQFERAAQEFRGSASQYADEKWWAEQLATYAEWFAQRTQRSRGDVLRAFGMSVEGEA